LTRRVEGKRERTALQRNGAARPRTAKQVWSRCWRSHPRWRLAQRHLWGHESTNQPPHQDNNNGPSIVRWSLGSTRVADGTFAPNETHNTSNNTREAEDTAMQRLLQRHHHTKACSTKLCSDIQEGKPCSQTTFCCYKQKMHRVLMGYASNAARKTMDDQKYRKTR